MTAANDGATTGQSKPTMLTKALVYGIPAIGMKLILAPVVMVLTGIYAKYYGLALTTIALVMLVARVFDAVTDPVIGYYSDRFRIRTGSRKPFFAVGGLLLMPCSYFLFVPPGGVGAAYFTFWYMAFYLALTIFTIPYLAWANEFTMDSQDKTLVFSVMAFLTQGGDALFYLIPLLPFFATTDITPQVLQVTVILGAVLLLLGLVLTLKIVPDGPRPVAPVVLDIQPFRSSLFQQVVILAQAMLSNKPFVLFVAAYTCLGVGVGMWFGLFFIYVDSHLHLGTEFAKVSLWGFLAGALSIPIWYRLTLLMGKRQAWLLGMLLLTVVFLCTRLLNPGDTGFNALFTVNMLVMFAAGSLGVIANPMLCDTIDYGRLKDNVERNATYFSIFTLLTKMQVAIGGALGIAITGWFGFDVNANEQADMALIGLHIGISWIPALFVGLAMIFIALMPLGENRMTVIRKRLAQRDQAAQIKNLVRSVRSGSV